MIKSKDIDAHTLLFYVLCGILGWQLSSWQLGVSDQAGADSTVAEQLESLSLSYATDPDNDFVVSMRSCNDGNCRPQAGWVLSELREWQGNKMRIVMSIGYKVESGTVPSTVREAADQLNAAQDGGKWIEQDGTLMFIVAIPPDANTHLLRTALIYATRVSRDFANMFGKGAYEYNEPDKENSPKEDFLQEGSPVFES